VPPLRIGWIPEIMPAEIVLTITITPSSEGKKTDDKKYQKESKKKAEWKWYKEYRRACHNPK